MSNSWAFSQLNQLTPSPGISPHNGPDATTMRNDTSLSFPCDGNALQAQLEAWTTVAFDFDSATGADDSVSAAPNSVSLDASTLKLDNDLLAKERYSRLGSSNTGNNGQFAFNSNSSSVDIAATGDLDALLSTSLAPVSALDPYASLVDPALHLPAGGNAIASTSSDMIADVFTSTSPFIKGYPSLSAASASVDASSATSPSIEKTSITATKTAKKASKATPKPKKVVAAVVETPAASLIDVESPADYDSPKLVLVDGDDEANRLAIEEDKRKRNTAASARFRIKKKQREQALESTAKELRDRVAALEAEVAGLRTENGWLRGLIVEKPSKEVDQDNDTKLLLSGSRKRGREEEQDESVIV